MLRLHEAQQSKKETTGTLPFSSIQLRCQIRIQMMSTFSPLRAPGFFATRALVSARCCSSHILFHTFFA